MTGTLDDAEITGKQIVKKEELNKVLAAEYKTALPSEKQLVTELN